MNQRIRITCPTCGTAKVLSVRLTHFGKRIRTRCQCGVSIIAKPGERERETADVLAHIGETIEMLDRLTKRAP